MPVLGYHFHVLGRSKHCGDDYDRFIDWSLRMQLNTRQHMNTKVTFNRAILRVDFLSIVPHCLKTVSSSFLYIYIYISYHFMYIYILYYIYSSMQLPYSSHQFIYSHNPLTEIEDPSHPINNPLFSHQPTRVLNTAPLLIFFPRQNKTGTRATNVPLRLGETCRQIGPNRGDKGCPIWLSS